MSQTGQLDAVDISQALLDLTGEALISGDFELFAGSFHVPQHVATMGQVNFIETLTDLRRAFDALHQHFVDEGVTELRRNCVTAKYTSSTRIESSHVSEMMQGETWFKPPYPNFSVLEKIDGHWKVTGGEYALDKSDGQAIALARADAKRRIENSTTEDEQGLADQYAPPAQGKDQ